MKVNFTDAITITQLFQNDDIKENHFKSLNSTERRVCMAAFRILKERTIDNPPKKEHKHLNQKIIQNITDKLNGPEPVKGKKRLHKINSLFKGIANRFFGRISSSKIIIAMTAYNADLNNAKNEIKDLKMNIRNEEAELKTSNEEYGQLLKDHIKLVWSIFYTEIMYSVFNSHHYLDLEYRKKTFDKLSSEQKAGLTKINGKERNDDVKELRTIKKNNSETLKMNKKKFDVSEKKITGLKKNISRLNEQVEIRNKKYALGTSNSSS